MSTRLQADFDNFLSWWADGLSPSVWQRAREHRLRFKQFLLARSEGDTVVIEHHRQGQDAAVSRHTVALSDHSRAERIEQWLLRHTEFQSLPVVLRLKTDTVLVKRLRYPKAAAANLRNVIGYDIDRQTPFAREDVYFDFIRHETNDRGDHISVDLLVLPLREIAPLESLLRDHGLRVSIIDIENHTYDDEGINLAPESDVRHGDRAPYLLRFALFLTWMALIAAIPGKQVFETERAIAALAAQERHALADIRDLQNIRAEHQRIVEQREFFARREAPDIPVVAILDELTKLLPDGTWVERLDLKNGAMTMTGESDQASEVPGIIEGSPRFFAPRFSSPVTRNNGTGKDRFQIVFNLDDERSL
ncbi:MAG: PilN domain-containing protein [Gammaproteobacteria bacterium]